MTDYLARKLAKLLWQWDAITEEDLDIYVLGFDVVISTATTTAAVLLAGLLLNNVIGAVLFLVCFAHIRNFSGGYHASTRFRCLAVTVFCYLAAYVFAEIMNKMTGAAYIGLVGVVTSGSAAVFYLRAPVENKNKRLPEKWKQKNRIGTFYALGFWLVIAVICFLKHMKAASQILATIGMVAFMIVMVRRNSNEES